MAANLELIISATDKASGALSSIDKKASGLGSTLSNIRTVGAVAAVAGLGAVVAAGVSFVKAAAEEEAGIKKLAAAVDANGGSWANNAAAIEEVIRQRQKLAFADDEQRESLAFLIAQTGNVDEALRRQAVAMDLARGAGIDLASASKLLGKVTDESHAALGRLGITVDKNATSQEVLAAVQARFAGQSAAFADSTAGKWARFNIQVDNIKETIGAALLPLLTRLADKLAVFLEEHQADIERIVASWSEFAQSDIFPILERAFLQLQQLIKGIMDTGIIQWLADHKLALIALGVALGGLALAFGGPVTAIIVLITAGTLLLAHWDQIRAKIDQILADFNAKFPAMAEVVTTIFELIKNRVMFYVDLVRNIIKIAVALWHGDFGAAWDGIKALFSDSLGHILFEVTHVMDLIKQAFAELGPFVLSQMQALFGSIVRTFAPLGEIIANPFDTAKRAVQFLIDKIRELINLVPSIPKPDLSPGFNAPGVPGVPGLRSIFGGSTIAPLPAPATTKGGTVIFQSVVPAGPAEMQRAAITIREILRS